MNTQTQEALIYIKNLEWALRHIKPSTRNVDQLAWDTIEKTLALRPTSIEELEQPAQEPVAWMNDIAFSMDKELLGTRSRIVPLYTHPAPAKEFVTLTDDDISRVIGNMRKDNHGNLFNDFDFAYAIGQATALKNGMELSDG
jgi:hypothetical protein